MLDENVVVTEAKTHWAWEGEHRTNHSHFFSQMEGSERLTIVTPVPHCHGANTMESSGFRAQRSHKKGKCLSTKSRHHQGILSSTRKMRLSLLSSSTKRSRLMQDRELAYQLIRTGKKEVLHFPFEANYYHGWHFPDQPFPKTVVFGGHVKSITVPSYGLASPES